MRNNDESLGAPIIENHAVYFADLQYWESALKGRHTECGDQESSFVNSNKGTILQAILVCILGLLLNKNHTWIHLYGFIPFKAC